MRNCLSLRPLQANSQTPVLMPCGRNSQPWSDLRHERLWKSLVSARVSFHRSVFTTSRTLLQRFVPITMTTQPLLRNSAFVSTLNLQRNTFHPLQRMSTTKFQNSWKRLKRLVKISQTIEPWLMSIVVESTPTTFEANHSRSKQQPNHSLIPTFHVLHCRRLLMMENCLNG